MENRRIVSILVLVLLIWPGAVVAYSRDTHKGLSEAIIQSYEQKNGDKFSAQEEEKFIQGSWDEDEGWRFMRHFYDPVNNTGLLGQYEASKYWVQNTEAQANYECVGAWFCYGDDVDYTEKFFSSPTDFSWDRAVYEYAWGDKARAVATLGHIAHLIEDATVPAHVRNDAHPSKFGVTFQEDVYERYASQFVRGNIVAPRLLVTASYTSLGHAFDDVALFTNKNFISKDTVVGVYEAPNLTQLTFSQGYVVHSMGHKVARAERDTSFSGGNKVTRYLIDDDSDTVATDYWRVLSKKAIESGVGVIDLFFREVEKEKKTGVLKAKNTSAAERRAKDSAKKYFGVVKGLYGSSLSQSDVEELLGEGAGQAGAAALAVSTNNEPEPTVTQPASPTREPTPQQAEDAVEPAIRRSSEVPIPLEIVSPGAVEVASSSATSTPQPQQLVPVTPGFGGGGSPAREEAPAPAPAPEPVSLNIASPTEGTFFATTTVTFSGTTVANGLLTLESATSTATTTADVSGNWFSQLVLDEGNPAVIVRATDNSGERATSTSVSIFVDVIPPSLPTVSLPQCANSLSTGFCLLATTSVATEWAEVTGAAYYALEVGGILGATTTATSSVASISFGATSSIAVVAYDLAGNAATSTSEHVYAIERPLVINEIAWAGTEATETDEWIELKNTSSFDIDLSRVVIGIDSSTTTLSGTLASGAMYLIEDRAEATSKIHDLVLDADLLDTGAVITLSDMENNIVDATPDVSTCSGWCAGSATAAIGTSAQFGNMSAKLSMERIDSSTDGSLASSWRNNDTYIRISVTKATDSAAGTVYGTPGMTNSAGLPSAGWDCGSGVLTTSGGSYNPTSSACTYLSAFISTQANRYGDVYRGTVGSSTLVTGHSLSKSIQSDQDDSGVVSGAVSGDQYFVAIYEIRNGPAFSTDLTDFRSYLKTGVGTTPHNNYVTILWTYAP